MEPCENFQTPENYVVEQSWEAESPASQLIGILVLGKSTRVATNFFSVAPRLHCASASAQQVKNQDN